jgi:RES domain-containing protein
MKVWRLCRARHASTAFDGEGARLYGGRWNQKGLPMVYTSATLSLAALEVLVHHRVPIPPFEFVALVADIPTRLKIETIRPQDLPTDWQADPAPVELQDLGSAWLQRASSLVLVVPSVIIATEFNYLINPRHPDFARLKIQPATPFTFDGRLWT